MAKFSLIPFHSSEAPALHLEAEINITESSIFISYRINEGVSLVDLGNGTPKKERVMKLWEKTCFELFIKKESGQYMEFNFSPVFEWNCFYFEKKGDALKEYEPMLRPVNDILLSKDHFLIFTEIKKDYFPRDFFSGELSAGISSVIKTKSGQISYWALAHCDQRPNFHHFDSFKYKF